MKSVFRKIFQKQLYGSAWSRAVFTNAGIIIREMTCAFPQFFTVRAPLSSFLRSLRYLLLPLLRLLQGRGARLSFAYTGEDRIIESILKPVITQTGFYVDVGCNDPRFISNSFLFYKRGWRGICIDPNEKLIRKFHRIRPKDTAVCALISDTEKITDFYLFENEVLSSMDHTHLERQRAEGLLPVAKRPMKTRTLNSVLNESRAPQTFDFLSIDTEENDFAVLKSIDLTHYTPLLIIIEAEDFNPAMPSENKIFRYLQNFNYELEGYILKNLYFRKREQQITFS